MQKTHNLEILELVPATPQDIDLVMIWESKEANVISWSKTKHEATMRDPDFLHLIVRKKDSAESIGYAILRKGFPDPSSVEFLRLVISDEFKGCGYGTSTLKHVWNLVFFELGYTRLWHDVFAENTRAVQLYDRLGYNRFKTEPDPGSGRQLYFYEMLKDDKPAKLLRADNL